MSLAGIDVAAVPLDPFVEGIVLGADADFDVKVENFNIDILKNDVGTECLNDQDKELEQQLLTKDRSNCSRAELQRIRREKNRMHARKARFRKKKILEEMLSVSFQRHP
jgi:molecular chaperone GrpE (heat shock protein)